MAPDHESSLAAVTKQQPQYPPGPITEERLGQMVNCNAAIDFAQGGVDMRRPREPADRHSSGDREHVFVDQLTGVRADDLCPDDFLTPSSLIEYFDFPGG